MNEFLRLVHLVVKDFGRLHLMQRLYCNYQDAEQVQLGSFWHPVP